MRIRVLLCLGATGALVLSHMSIGFAAELPKTTRRAQLAYVVTGGPDGNGIAIARGDGTHSKLLVSSDRQYAAPSWSPDGAEIVFDSDQDGDGQFDLFTMHADGSGLRNITPDGTGNEAGPAWSPAGDLIAFTSNRDGGAFALYVVAPDGSGLRKLSDGSAAVSNPAWAPDGQTIVFSQQVPGNAQESDVWTIRADGTALTQLTTTPRPDAFPEFSPDGSQIVFVSQRDIFPRVFTMRADGGRQRPASPDAMVASFPTWSPDGTRIAWVGQSAPEEPTDVFTVRADGSGLRNVSRTIDHSERVTTWAPDGRAIATTSAFAGVESILVMRASDGKALTIVGADAARATFPTWRPPSGR